MREARRPDTVVKGAVTTRWNVLVQARGRVITKEAAPALAAHRLLGQIVAAFGRGSGIGLENARPARAEGAQLSSPAAARTASSEQWTR